MRTRRFDWWRSIIGASLVSASIQIATDLPTWKTLLVAVLLCVGMLLFVGQDEGDDR